MTIKNKTSLCYLGPVGGDLAIICGVLRCFAVFCGVLRCFAVFCGVLRCFAVFCGVLRCFAVFCGVLRRFVAFFGVLWCVGDKFPLRDQIFGGAQTPAPFSGRLKIFVPKWGGSGPLSPLKTFLGSTIWHQNGNECIQFHFVFLIPFSFFLV